MTTILAFLRINWLHIAIGLGLAFVVYQIDQNGYERAESKWQAREQRILDEIKDMEKRLAEQMDELDRDTAERIGKIDSTERTIVAPIITKEIQSDPRFSDPAQGITPAMRDAINAARKLSAE